MAACKQRNVVALHGMLLTIALMAVLMIATVAAVPTSVLAQNSEMAAAAASSSANAQHKQSLPNDSNKDSVLMTKGKSV